MGQRENLTVHEFSVLWGKAVCLGSNDSAAVWVLGVPPVWPGFDSIPQCSPPYVGFV